MLPPIRVDSIKISASFVLNTTIILIISFYKRIELEVLESLQI